MPHPRPKMIPSTDVSLEAAQLRRLQSRVERLFSVLEEALETEAVDGINSFAPTIDLCEMESAVQIAAELPGVEAKDINLIVTAKDICIEGEKKHSQVTDEAVSHFCCERQYGRFRRRINLRWAININDTTAELRDGTLRINLPKLIDRRGKSVRIPVESKD